VVTDERQAEYESVITSVAHWARDRADVVAVAIVGSWARGEADMDSDVDLVVVTSAKDLYIASESWITEALGSNGDIVRTQQWGPLTERRVRIASGLELEFGFVDPAWADTHPVDAGTASVVRSGLIPLEDSASLLDYLLAAVCS
jgi:predicted nucleotidyltransferase